MCLSLEQIQQNLDALNAAYQKSLAGGGVSSYTINTGQGSTTVKVSSPAELLEQIKHWTYMKNETKEHSNGSHVTIARKFNGFRLYSKKYY